MTKKPFARRAFLCGVNSVKTAIAYSLCYVLIFFVLSCHFCGIRTVFVLARLFSSASNLIKIVSKVKLDLQFYFLLSVIIKSLILTLRLS